MFLCRHHRMTSRHNVAASNCHKTKRERMTHDVRGIASSNVLMYASRMDEIAKEIADRRARLEEIKTSLLRLEREKIVAEAELGAYEHARKFYLGEGAQRPTPHADAAHAPPKTPGRTARALTGQWLETMRGVGHLDTFGVDDILAAAEAKGHSPTRDNIRSQVHNYKGRGIVESPSQGVYKFTEAGREALKLDDESGASEDAEEAAEKSYPPHPEGAHNEKAPH